MDEENGTLTVFVRVLDGELTSDVDIELNTVDDSATSSGTLSNRHLQWTMQSS